MKKLLLFLCAIVLVFAGLLTPCHATPVTEFYQSYFGIYESVYLPGFGDTGKITSVIDFTYPADQKYTFDFSAGSFYAHKDTLFYFENFPILNPLPLSLTDRGRILPGGDPTNFTALTTATEVIDDTSSLLYGLKVSYESTYDVLRNEILGTGTLDATTAGLLIGGEGAIPFKGKGAYTSGTSPVPEPGTILLLGSGVVCLVGFRRKFKK